MLATNAWAATAATGEGLGGWNIMVILLILAAVVGVAVAAKIKGWGPFRKK